MSTLNYKTRGNSSAQGKPRVYFCCHRDDFKGYFEEISDEILAKQNCAVYYYPPEAKVSDEERALDLGEMQLFVMPVTTRLLRTENTAMSDFDFATEHHIPVLPLMQEKGLEEMFNKKCGDLQFLDKRSTDPTVISYDEKLEKYLSAVLIGDELAAKVRAAFDAYVFLSYRKKDRKYAQELMRLVHKNDFCRDIAIWYDEFLVPGENFNSSIRSALQKSDLFMLTVTPNLVNEENYIKTTEYPMAIQENKPIIPAELVPTDPKLLAENYENIPPCVNTKNEAELSDALLSSVKKMAVKENDASPEHNFFIGLAYLDGIDVEVDHTRAVELITGAANANLPEAMKKLVDMYRSGKGVARSYETAITWQRKLVNYYKEKYEKTQNPDDGHDGVYEFIYLGDYIYELRKLGEAKKAYLEAKALCEKLCENGGSTAQIDLATCYRSLGNIYEAEGNLLTAKEYYEKSLESLEINEVLAKGSEAVQALWVLGDDHNNLGDVCHAEGNLPAAIKYYMKAFEIFGTLAKYTDAVEARRELSVCYEKLGYIYETDKNLSAAKIYYEKSLEIRETLAKETGTAESRCDLAGIYNNLGNIYEFEKNLQMAKVYYEKSLEIKVALEKETGTVQARRDVSVAYNNLGNIYKAEKNLLTARECYEKSLEIREDLANTVETIESYDDLAMAYYNLGLIGRNNRQLITKAYDIWCRLADTCPDNPLYAERRDIVCKILESNNTIEESNDTMESMQKLADRYDKLGDIFRTEEDLQTARKYYEKSLEIRKAIAKETDTVEARRNLSDSYNNIGIIYVNTGSLPLARECFEKMLEISKTLAKETGTVEARQNLAGCYINLGNICHDEGNLPSAKEYFEKSLEIFKVLVKETGTIQASRDLSLSYNNLGTICKTEKNLRKAKRYFKKSIKIREALAMETGTIESYNDLATSYYNLGFVKNNDRQLLTKAYNIWRHLAQACPDNPTYAKNRDMVHGLLFPADD